MSTYQLQKDFDSQLSLSNSRATDRTYSKEKGIPSSYHQDPAPYMQSHESIHRSHDPVSSSHDFVRSSNHRSSPAQDSRSTKYSFTENEGLDQSSTYSPYSTQNTYAYSSPPADQGHSPYTSPTHQDKPPYSDPSRHANPLYNNSAPRDGSPYSGSPAHRGNSPYSSPSHPDQSSYSSPGPQPRQDRSTYSNPAPQDMSAPSRFEVRASPLNKAQYRDSPERNHSPVESPMRRGYSPDRGYSQDGTVESYGKTRYGVDLSPRRSPSPYQERPTATQTYYYSDEGATPEPAESRLVFSGPAPNQFNFAQSRPAGSSPTSSPQSAGFKTNYTNSRSEASTNQYSPKPQFQSPSHTVDYKDPVSSNQPMKSPGNSNQPMRSPPAQTGPMTKGGTKLHEAEVDALTSLLMQNMEAAADPDFFGQCADCGEAILGESNACLAMDKMFHVSCFACVECGMCAKCARAIIGEDVGCKALDELYHIDCFTCTSCSTGLKGSQFYAMEGKLYCESCYVNTLEKCSVCSEPITDKIVRATGKPYHSQCFVCVVCKQNMEGVPFTVDSANQVHCIHDFHRKFAPRCCVCELPIMPKEGEEEAVRIVAMDRSFHMACYKCEDCGIVLSSEAEGRGCYPLDEHILCKMCNAQRIQKLTSKMTTEL